MSIYRVNGRRVSKEEFLKDSKLDFSTKGTFYVTFGMKEYVSPLSGELVTSKVKRREEMKKYEVREVDPSECGKWKQHRKEEC